ncbi:hypothetical protein ACB098_01G322300 [Castanea mollissima]|uniref:WD repeat-containing protein 76 n=1 Tax=Castanea mollissima TaxID=60419 RepID=A0A8J4VMT2_9ROSI|nr:hypothetical protein CMV_019467 [Castanea mollissima]
MASSQKLTEYERKRLENIRRNDEMMAALKIHSKATELSASSSAKRQRVVTKSYKVSPEKKPKTQSPIVIRRSLRTRGMPPEYSDFKALEDTVEATPMAAKSSTQSNPSPRDLGPLSSRDAYRGTGSDKLLMDRILGVSKKPHEEFGDENGGDSIKGVCDRLELGSLSLNPENIARVVPGRIMNVRFLPCSNSRMIVVGNKFGDVGFWDVDSSMDEDGIYLYHPHPGPISGISIQQQRLSKIFTSCYFGFIRLMDAEKEVFDLVYSSDDSIYSLSQRPDNIKCLYFSEGRGGFNIWDERVGKCSTQWNLHEDRINSIDFNSENPNIMATSSSDGTACIWDLRSVNVDQPKPLREVRHNRAVQSAYFSPSGSSLATTSTDDTVGIVTGVNFDHTSMIKHNNQTGRWISSFRAIWGWDDSYVFIGNMKRGVDVISPAQKRTIFTLESPHMSAIPCRFDAHPFNVGMLAGATSGGQVYMWTLG